MAMECYRYYDLAEAARDVIYTNYIITFYYKEKSLPLSEVLINFPLHLVLCKATKVDMSRNVVTKMRTAV